MSDGYRTLAETALGELEEKRSRFIAEIAHVTDEEQAVAHIERIRAENRKARHNVYAYLLREGNVTRYSDDGEPQGTGGVPVLETLRGAGLTDVCCVVTRYFGGILLGTGGLARAYSGACRAALDSAKVMEIRRCSRFDFYCDYDLYGRVGALLPELGAKTLREDFGENVSMSVIVESDRAEKFREKLTNASNGRISFDETADLYEDFSR